MNNLMVLAGLVLVVCVMNSKDLMKSDLVKSLSSKSKSLKMDNTTILVLGFVVIVLFICMSKNIEGFKMVETDKLYEVGDAKLDGVCRSGPMTLIVEGSNVASNPNPLKAFHPSLGTIGQFTPDVPDPDLYKYLYGCLNGPNASAFSADDWSRLPDDKFEDGDSSPTGNNSSAYCALAVDGSPGRAKVCSRFKSRDCIGDWSSCGIDCQKTYHISSPGSGGTECEAVERAQGTCEPGEDLCPPDVDCGGTMSACTDACEKANKRSFTMTTPKSGNGQECPVPGDCQNGDGACVVNLANRLGDDFYKVVDDSAKAFGNQLGNKLSTQLAPSLVSAVQTLTDDTNTILQSFETILNTYIEAHPEWITAISNDPATLNVVTTLVNSKAPTIANTLSVICATGRKLPGLTGTCPNNVGAAAVWMQDFMVK